MEVRDVDASREPGNIGTVPFDGKCDRRIAQYAEIEAVMRLLPDVFAVEHHVAPERLLQARVEFVAKAGRQNRVRSRRAQKKHGQDVVVAAEAGKHQVLVEGSL